MAALVQLLVAMVSKTHKSHLTSKGFTLLELVISLGLVIALGGIVILAVNVSENKSKTRDLARLSDITYLESAIAQFIVVNKSCPDATSTLRRSDTIPNGSTTGWINQSLTAYAPKLPVDPLNDNTYHYSYRCTGIDYELSAALEYHIDKETSDGGNNNDAYETGTDLTLIN